MDQPELARKQKSVLVAIKRLAALSEQLDPRYAVLQMKLNELSRLYQFAPFSRQRRRVKQFMGRCMKAEKEMKRVQHAAQVATHKVEAIRDIAPQKKHNLATFNRTLDRAQKSMDRVEKTLNDHLQVLNDLITEADKILES